MQVMCLIALCFRTMTSRDIFREKEKPKEKRQGSPEVRDTYRHVSGKPEDGTVQGLEKAKTEPHIRDSLRIAILSSHVGD